MIPKIQTGEELFVEATTSSIINEVYEQEEHYGVEMSKKTSNTGDKRQKRES
ncbi:hypothetical protein [Tenacibaculum litoreum]|uniref:hypothetical protein n=1 Tax=Tenacibaculum litoreum TaxID=321269 RepID=UPI0038B4ECA4